MTIIERHRVREAIARAMLTMHPVDTEAAVERAAESLCIPVEAAQEVLQDMQSRYRDGLHPECSV